MLDTSNSRSADPNDTAWELIPWYVNGTLPPHEKEVVERRLQTSPEFAMEVARQHSLAKKVAKVDPFDAPVSRSWGALQAQIKADQNARKPRRGAATWFGGLNGGIMMAGAGLAACLVAAVLIVPAVYNPSNDFKTLTSPTSGAGLTIQFQTIRNLDPNRLSAILAEHGLALESGPSESGVYTAKAPEQADLEVAAKGLMQAPEIIFASPGE